MTPCRHRDIWRKRWNTWMSLCECGANIRTMTFLALTTEYVRPNTLEHIGPIIHVRGDRITQTMPNAPECLYCGRPIHQYSEPVLDNLSPAISGWEHTGLMSRWCTGGNLDFPPRPVTPKPPPDEKAHPCGQSHDPDATDYVDVTYMNHTVHMPLKTRPVMCSCGWLGPRSGWLSHVLWAEHVNEIRLNSEGDRYDGDVIRETREAYLVIPGIDVTLTLRW